ncbi:MAG: DUF87 domain-containing protein [Treponema sp.]|nr:DUF87 domain-containing protein [Treponema sp.]
MEDSDKKESINEKLATTGLDAAVLENNLSRIAYTLDREYLSHLDEYGVLKFGEYCADRKIDYSKSAGFLNYAAIKVSGFVINKEEKVFDCMENVIGAFSNSMDSLGFIMHRKRDSVDLYFIFKKDGEVQPSYVGDKLRLLQNSFLGNFPGSTVDAINSIDDMQREFKFFGDAKFISMLSAVPSEKSEDYISQGIEKLLNGVIPGKEDEEYAVMILAESITQEGIRQIISGFEEMATSITPYASHQFQTGTNEAESNGEMKSSTDTTGISHAITKTHSINVGVSVGRSTTNTSGINESITNSESDTDTEGTTDTETNSESDTTGESESDTKGGSESETKGHSESEAKGTSDTVGGAVSASTTLNSSATAGASVGVGGTGVNASATVGTSVTGGVSADYHHGWNKTFTKATNYAKTTAKNYAKTKAKSFAKNIGKSMAKSIARSAAKTVGRAVTAGTFSSVAKMLSLGLSGGYGYSWGKIDTNSESKSITDGTNHNVTLGSSENTTYTYKSYQVNDLLQNLEMNIKRITESKATGLWKTATYVLSKDGDTASRVANYLRGLTQGDESFLETAIVQQWKKETDDTGKDIEDSPFPEIKEYLTHFTHPVLVNSQDLDFNETSKQDIIDAAKEELKDSPELSKGLEEAIWNYSGTGADIIPVTPTTNVSTTELARIFSLPTHSLPGLPVLECAEFGRNVASYDIQGEEQVTVTLGKIFHMHREEALAVQLDADSLASHAFITGSTGSGKSNTVYQLLGSLKSRGVNFLVVEPAKGEYKNVFGGQSDVFVYGTNPDLTPLLRINPFSFPHGDSDASRNIHILEHLDRLVEIFNVCWPMYAAMPAVLKEAVEKSYEDCGWNLTESTNEYGDDLYPTFADITRNIRTIIDSSEYDAENKGAYKGSLITRLKALTNGINGLIFTADDIEDADLFDRNVIVDLSRVGSTETKSLIMGLLVLKLQEHRMTHSGMNEHLRHVTVLEEAHNLLKRTSTEQSQDSGNLLGKSVEMLTNSIAEMRTYGEGFIIADQAPGLLDMAVIRNTNTKIIMRLPDQEDRELVGKAASLNDDQITELAKLPRGVAAVYQNEWVQPVLCKVRKFTGGEKAYQPRKDSVNTASDNIKQRLEIAKLLCKGTAVKKEAAKDYVLHKLGRLSASTQVAIMKTLFNPLPKPRYTKLAPIVSELFPDVRKAFVTSYAHTNDTEQWTRDVDDAIRASLKANMDEELLRDIRQCVITDYLHNELNKDDQLERWSKTGGIK